MIENDDEFWEHHRLAEFSATLLSKLDELLPPELRPLDVGETLSILNIATAFVVFRADLVVAGETLGDAMISMATTLKDEHDSFEACLRGRPQ